MAADGPVDTLGADLVATGAGDRTAFCRLYHATAPRLLAVFVRIWHSAARFDPDRARPMTWLGSIARNAAIDWYRTQRPAGDGSDQAIEAIPSASEPVDARIIREEGEDRAMGLVHELDEDLESQVHRICLEGMTYAEAAEADGIPLRTLKSRLRRALITIRAKMLDD